MQNTSQHIVSFKPVQGPREAFKDGSWKNPIAEGPLGKIVWNGWTTNTICAHVGVDKEGKFVTVSAPAANGTTCSTRTCDELAARFADPIVYGRRGLIYERLGSTTGFELECALAGIHGCGDAMVFGSGMAGLSHLAFLLLSRGENVVVHKNVYGCSDNLFSQLLPELGFETRFVDMRDPRNVRRAINSKTRFVFFETPSNPSLDLIDIGAVASEVKGRCPVVVDNTFASPIGQDPFKNGANITIYSLTKSIGGHTTAMGGAVLGSGEFLAHLFPIRKDIGGIMPGREAEAFLNGIKTLPLRYERMEKNAIEIANLLASQNEVQTVHYPLFDASYPALEGKQMNGPGYVFAFELKGGLEAAKKFTDSLGIFTIAVSLGGTESLVCHSASTTHACIAPEARIAKGITDGLIRMSIGIENVEELKNDILQAFRKLAA